MVEYYETLKSRRQQVKAQIGKTRSRNWKKRLDELRAETQEGKIEKDD